VYARNILDYWNMSNTYKYEVKEDMIPPTFYEILRDPESPTESDSVTILVDVDDESSISEVILSYGTDTAWTNTTMIFDGAVRYYKAVIPTYPGGTVVYYRVYACDTYGNWATSDLYNYTVKDTLPPEITNVLRPIQTPSESDPVKIMANVSDDSGVQEVILSYYNGSYWSNITMIYNSTTGYYEATIPPLPAGTTVKYVIYAIDIYGSVTKSGVYEYRVIELQPPVIYEVERLLNTPTDTDYVKILANATDNSGLSQVILSYSGETLWINITMEYNTTTGYYEALIPPFPAGTTVTYRVYAIDVYGNSAVSSDYRYLVMETRPPIIYSVTRSIEAPSSTDYVLVMANVSDDSGVQEVVLSYYNGSCWSNITMIYNSTTGYYEATIPPLLAGTHVDYIIYAVDIYGNTARSIIYQYSVIELNPPVIHEVSRNIEEPTEADSVRILANVSDDSGVSCVILSYYDGGCWYNITMAYNETAGLYEARIPTYPSGTKIVYRVIAYDIYGNFAKSDLYNYTITSVEYTTTTYVSAPTGIPPLLAVVTILTLLAIIIVLLLRRKKGYSQ